MRDRALRTLVPTMLAAWAIVIAPSPSRGQDKAAASPKKVLVELYTSQGCDSCPPASDLLGRLAALGYGPDQVVPLNFHVDYFNTPWADPFSNPAHSDRQQSYNQVLGRTDLYFTPLMMVDGRYPLLGSNREQAVGSIRQARAEPARVALKLSLDGPALRKTVAVKLAARTAEVAGRDLLIGVALTQERTSTRVPSGENAGKTLVEHHVVRRLDHRFTKLDRTDSKTLSFPVSLPDGSDPARFRITAFAQDRTNGQVYQADAIPWTPPASAETKTTSR